VSEGEPGEVEARPVSPHHGDDCDPAGWHVCVVPAAVHRRASQGVLLDGVCEGVEGVA
jgi:hypothetical protein